MGPPRETEISEQCVKRNRNALTAHCRGSLPPRRAEETLAVGPTSSPHFHMMCTDTHELSWFILAPDRSAPPCPLPHQLPSLQEVAREGSDLAHQRGDRERKVRKRRALRVCRLHKVEEPRVLEQQLREHLPADYLSLLYDATHR